MKKITDCNDVKGKYVIVRSSCNVPLVEGKVGNTYRLTRAVPTISWLKSQGAKVIVIAHIGREATDTLKPVCDAFSTLVPMTWGGKIGESQFNEVHASMKDGDVVMAENLRQDEREASEDAAFAAMIAAYGEIYVNDAFDNIHRDHASMTILPTLLPAYAGITLFEEVEHITRAMTPISPSLFIIGGAKFETKLPLIEKYLATYDHVFVGGALHNDIMVADGHSVGTSLISDITLKDAPFLSNPKLIKAVDVVVRSAAGDRIAAIDDVAENEMVIDIGPASLEVLHPYVAAAKTILWNGPLGLYENGAPGSTHALARMIAASDAFSVIGGGDTVAAIEELGLNDKFGFVSTGGGAMLTLLEEGPTRSLKALG